MGRSYEDYMELYNKHVFTCFMSKPEKTPVSYRGENDVIYALDEGGESAYVDANSGCFGPLVIGYSNPYLVEAIRKQAARMIHNMSPSTIADTVIEFSQKVASIAPEGFNNSFLVTSGALAVEAAMHIGWQATGKRGGIALTGAFHGWTVGARSISSFAPFKYGFNNIPGIAFLPRPYCYRCPYSLKYPECDLHCANALRDVIKYGGGYDAAFFIMEPIQGFGGHITPPSKEYFKIISQICREHELLFIVDEVQNGIGKTGAWFATGLYDIPADIIVLGKGLGGGLPIGDVLLSDETVERLKRNYVGGRKQTDKIFYGTHTMDPIIAAAAIAVLEYIEQNNLIERSKQLGEYLTKTLLEIQQESRIIGDIRGPGLYVGVEFVKDRESKESYVEGMQKFLEFAWEHGVIFQAGGENYCVLKIKPPLTIEEKNLDKILEVVRDGVKEVENKMHI
jgi:4-aminobutyrate aminotransferase/(S)-3-amino-2-methylpropionate transaminase